MAIKCCNGCVAPKRHPGCHGKCPEYLGEKSAHDELREAVNKRKAIECGLDSQFVRSVYRSKKG